MKTILNQRLKAVFGGAVAAAVITVIWGSCRAETAADGVTNAATAANYCTVAITGVTTTYDPIAASASDSQDVTPAVTTTCRNPVAVTTSVGVSGCISSGRMSTNARTCGDTLVVTVTF